MMAKSSSSQWGRVMGERDYFNPGITPIYTDGMAFVEPKEGGICMGWYVETGTAIGSPARTIVAMVYLPYSKIGPSRELVNALLQQMGQKTDPVEVPSVLVH